MIRNFDLEKDKASGATSIGVWRFGHEDEGFAKFDELEPLYPPYVKRPPTPAQIAVRDRVRKGLILPKKGPSGATLPKIHKGIQESVSKMGGEGNHLSLRLMH
jgi:hypothetical protein